MNVPAEHFVPPLLPAELDIIEGPAAARQGAVRLMARLPMHNSFLILHENDHPDGLHEIVRDLRRAGAAAVEIRRWRPGHAQLVVNGVIGWVMQMRARYIRPHVVGPRDPLWVRAQGPYLRARMRIIAPLLERRPEDAPDPIVSMLTPRH